MESRILRTTNFNAYFGTNHIVKNVSFDVHKNTIASIIGPSGCGKTTYLRCINRMHELAEGANVKGEIYFHNDDIYKIDPIALRRKIGMVFQRPNPFPSMSIYENTIAGYTLNGIKLSKSEKNDIVEESLTKAALWEEVKNGLHKKGQFLSGGQQQRLCIARALAVEPDIILMDEPCSALDPAATAEIETLIRELRERYTVIVVTHNLQQAARISDFTAFMYVGKLVEYGVTKSLFEKPESELVEQYITGKFG